MGLQVYFLTVAISFLTNIGIEIMKPITIKKMGYIKTKDYFKDYLEENLQIFQNNYGLKKGKIILDFLVVLGILFYLLITIAESIIPFGNLLISTIRVHLYDTLVNDELEKNDYVNFLKDEERLFGDVAKYNKFTDLNKKINEPKAKEIVDSLIIEGANRNQIVEMFNKMKLILNHDIALEKELVVNEETNNMVDYICMNTELTSKQKITLLKKLKKVYSKEHKMNMNPIDYVFKCSENKKLKKK